MGVERLWLAAVADVQHLGLGDEREYGDWHHDPAHGFRHGEET